MRASAKVGLVTIGYVLALVLAWATVAARVAMTSGPEAQASSGMYAAGDAILFLAVFGVASVPATATALFFLRSSPAFWRAVGWCALLVAGTALIATVGELLGRSAASGSLLADVAQAAPLRVFLAPPLALLWFVAVPFAPDRRARVLLCTAGGIEIGLLFSFLFSLMGSS